MNNGLTIVRLLAILENALMLISLIYGATRATAVVTKKLPVAVPPEKIAHLGGKNGL
jgi:hypothetical protein